ncbi:MAG: aldehyde dehydrogenase family protein [Gammaproteobacteria bacterium]|nr:aldehyde dehydrogenase family protein [Gammaproteobacteria bacterium]MCY4282717.1 aldehyde dehydrogenase family protein [Gammaproteobacteria bacterium]MCY4337345.1 aldehyde dehydrogenase family protein [Gammaproteobacteria bacterium]
MAQEPAVSEKISRFLATPRPMLINGDWVASASGETIPALNPATGEQIACSCAGDGTDVDKAVAAARAAFEAQHWRRMMPTERTRLLWKLAELIDENAEELAQLEALNQGKPIVLARQLDVAGAAESLRYYAGWCTKIEGLTTADLSFPDMRGENARGPAYHAYSLKEPIGVVGAIVPWNVPLLMAIAKMGPALAAGCTLVLKPAEETPLTTLRLGELIQAAGFPPGVVNIVTGYGHVVGAAIAAHPDIDKVAFTGSTETGRKIVRAATGNLKKVSMELGGKSPVIIFDDADLEQAIAGAAEMILLNCGQMCFAGSRLLVHEKLHDDVVQGVAAIARKTQIGPGTDPATELGPLVSARQRERVCEYIQAGRDEGAKVLLGGKPHGDKGYFMEPTILTGTAPHMRVVREEIFGPVLVTTPFRDSADLMEVARVANDTDYGLVATIWTRDLSRAHSLAAQIKAGMVWINTPLAFDETLPFGGFKQSGWGRESSRQCMDEYTESKSVIVAL